MDKQYHCVCGGTVVIGNDIKFARCGNCGDELRIRN